MTLSNILTTLRIVLSFLFVFMLFKGGMYFYTFALVVFVIAGFTDFFDGYFARMRNEHTLYGKIMDPIADKVLVLFAFGSFSYLEMVPWWIFWVIFLREILVTIIRIGFFHGNGKVLESSFKGKQKTFFQAVSILLIMIALIINEHFKSGYYPYEVMRVYNVVVSLSLGVTVGLTILSAIDVIVKAIKGSKDAKDI
jgi:CDP-diacylglycerol--glycerol-3-phosphate 3-phosphatidyltransferase